VGIKNYAPSKECCPFLISVFIRIAQYPPEASGAAKIVLIAYIAARYYRFNLFHAAIHRSWKDLEVRIILTSM
jgi:hypothetical protein